MYIQGLLLLYIPFKVNIIKIENIVHIDIDYSQFFFKYNMHSFKTVQIKFMRLRGLER